MTFQLPALAKGNCFTVVVGPLMALAKDQVITSSMHVWYSCNSWPDPLLYSRSFVAQSQLCSL